MKIIVTGSLGHISKPLTEELVQKGHNVTVVSSKAEKQKDIGVICPTPRNVATTMFNNIAFPFFGFLKNERFMEYRLFARGG